ncbi:amidase [Labrys wisconsinensis]|uniref:Amidase n=1 Tax=Labrys wisconsinensis TaxID=425677 RepID=A0ABU0J984_9HYPH|nr:amidase [Labrys wisconsinensis]MDQ0470824.1 amidase [Labrys wisconsinensis]
MTALHYWSIIELSEKIRRGEVSPVEVVRTVLARIEALDGRLNSYITVMGEQALARARLAEEELGRGQWRGPLHGVPLAAKDLFATRDAPTTAGMSIYRDHVPDHDATVIERLYGAGAILLGKLTLTEGAYTNNHPLYPVPLNPWNADYWAGTSSNGSGVATAAGLTFGALSTDTGGSIRFPSACNGITGIKPTWGRVSRHGVFTLSHSLDHVGPFARSAEDAAAILGVIAGPDGRDPTALSADVPDYLAATARGVRGLRIGVDEGFIATGTHPEVVAAVEAARRVLQGLGARIRPMSFPSPYEALRGWFHICGAETARVHAATYPSRAGEYHAGMAGLIEHGRAVSGETVAQAWVDRLAFSGRLAAAFQDVDLLLIPTMTTPTPTLPELEAFGADDEVLLQMIRYTAPFDLAGNPTIVLPCGFSSAGVPISLQLVGKPCAEDLLCAAGHAYQRATDWHLRRPLA